MFFHFFILGKEAIGKVAKSKKETGFKVVEYVSYLVEKEILTLPFLLILPPFYLFASLPIAYPPLCLCLFAYLIF
jgi:hypothetical protein